MNENITILKVKLVKEGKRLELSLKEDSVVQSDDAKSCKNPVHPDLVNAVKDLGVHLGILTDYISSRDFENPKAEELEKIEVSGYSIGGKEDEEGIMITGMRKNYRGKYFSINSPFERIYSQPEAKYPYMDDLMAKVNKIEKEVRAYLFDGKMAKETDEEESPYKQQSLFDPVTHMQVLPPETEEETALRKLKESQGGNGSDLYANPEAMQRVADMDGADRAGEDDPIGGAIEAMVQEQQQHMNGKKRKGKGK